MPRATKFNDVIVAAFSVTQDLTLAVGKAIIAAGGNVKTYSKTVTVNAADIVATGAGKLGHAAGVVLVADPGAGLAVELLSALIYTKYDTAAFGDGGNITINSNGGSALTGVVSAANSLGATADKINQFVPLATAGNALAANKGLNLVAAAAFTQPGTAAGYVKVNVTYRVHTL